MARTTKSRSSVRGRNSASLHPIRGSRWAGATPEDITIDAGHYLGKRGIAFRDQPVERIDAAASSLHLAGGEVIGYDYLLICTGPKLDFAAIKGLGPEGGHTQSVCTTGHAEHARLAYEQFIADPGPIVVGAAQGASCFGPAYEFAFILDADLRKRKLRDRVPMTLVTSEPYVGHLGLGGVGDSKGLMESELRKRHINWITNARILEATPTRSSSRRWTMPASHATRAGCRRSSR